MSAYRENFYREPPPAPRRPEPDTSDICPYVWLMFFLPAAVAVLCAVV